MPKIVAPLFLALFILVPGNAANCTITPRQDSLKVGDEAPQFVMRNIFLDEGVFLRNFTGKTLREPWIKKDRQIVVLSFWATWCQPCKNEIPVLTKVASEFKDQPVKFFLVNTWEKAEQTEDTIRETYNTRGYSLPCLVDPGGRYAGLYMVHGLPVLFVIDKFGIVRMITHGYHENFEFELEKMLKELVKEEKTVKK